VACCCGPDMANCGSGACPFPSEVTATVTTGTAQQRNGTMPCSDADIKAAIDGVYALASPVAILNSSGVIIGYSYTGGSASINIGLSLYCNQSGVLTITSCPLGFANYPNSGCLPVVLHEIYPTQFSSYCPPSTLSYSRTSDLYVGTGSYPDGRCLVFQGFNSSRPWVFFRTTVALSQ